MNAQMLEMATRVVYDAVARYEGHRFTPVLAILMEDAANAALNQRFPFVTVRRIAPQLNARGILDIEFKPRPPNHGPAP